MSHYAHTVRIKPQKFKGWRDGCAALLAKADEPMRTDVLHDLWLRTERAKREAAGRTIEPKRYPKAACQPQLLTRDDRFRNLEPTRIGGVKVPGHRCARWVLNTSHTSPD